MSPVLVVLAFVLICGLLVVAVRRADYASFHDYGRAHARRGQRVAVIAFEIVVCAAVLLNSSASWPMRVALFALVQVFTFASLAGVGAYYDPDD